MQCTAEKMLIWNFLQFESNLDSRTICVHKICTYLEIVVETSCLILNSLSQIFVYNMKWFVLNIYEKNCDQKTKLKLNFESKYVQDARYIKL